LSNKVGPYLPVMLVNARQFGRLLRDAADELALGPTNSRAAIEKLVSETSAIL
jgi:hypothetical protein